MFQGTCVFNIMLIPELVEEVEVEPWKNRQPTRATTPEIEDGGDEENENIISGSKSDSITMASSRSNS